MIENSFDQQSPAMDGQSGFTVGHEDLRVGRDVRYLHHTPGRPFISSPDRHQPHGRVQVGGRVVLTDCRFPNEADAIRDAGGQIIRVNRPEFPDDGDPHPSETALDRNPFDDLVLIDGTIDELLEKADYVAARQVSPRGRRRSARSMCS